MTLLLEQTLDEIDSDFLDTTPSLIEQTRFPIGHSAPNTIDHNYYTYMHHPF